MSMKPSVGGRKLLNGAIGTLCLNWVYVTTMAKVLP